MVIANAVSPSAQDLHWLRKQAGSAIAPRRLAERCHIVLLAWAGSNNEQIAAALGITRQKAARWRARFARTGQAGLENDVPGRGRKPTYGPQIEALIVERTLRTRRPWLIALQAAFLAGHAVFALLVVAPFWIGQ